MPTITKIHGYQRNATSISIGPQTNVSKEVLLVEAESPLSSMEDIRLALPSFASGPGTVALNPLQITFTLNQSRHYDNGHVLEQVSAGKRTNTHGNFWEFPLTYSVGGTGAIHLLTPQTIPNEKRKDQKVEKPDSTTAADNDPIIDPTSRPPIFTGSSKIVMRKSLHDLDGKIIRHTNGLPITKPIAIPVVHKSWSWEWNILASAYDEADFDVIANKTNSVALVVPQGTGDTYTIPINRIKCMGFSQKEVWETPDGGAQEFHYVKITGNFEVKDDPYDLPPASLHTKQLFNSLSDELRPIEINERGDKAKDPWPLDPNGVAVSYADLPTAVEADFGVLQADGADLVTVKSVSFNAFFSTHALELPGDQS